MDFRAFEATPGIHVIVLPDAPFFTHVAVSNDFLREAGMTRKDVIGKSHFDLFPKGGEDPGLTGETNLRASFEYSIRHKLPHSIPVQRYEVPDGDGNFRRRYRKITNVPMLDEHGQVEYLIHSATDISDQVLAEQNLASTKGVEKAYHLFMNAPVIIGILRGDDYVIELANEGLLEVWGRSAEVVGKPLVAAIPELEQQGFIRLLEHVRATGEPFYAYEYPITLVRHGKEEVLYFDFVYKPVYEDPTATKASGIISVGHDVTPQVKARLEIKESETRYRNLFESMHQGFCLLEMIYDENDKPADYRFLQINHLFEKQTGLKDAAGKTARELVPDLEPYWFELYGSVAKTGKAISFIEGSEAMGRWFEVSAFRMSESDNGKVALLFTDITERRRAEQAVRQSEQNLRNIILQAPVAMCILKGPDHIIEIANERMIEVMGKPATALLNKPVFEALSEARESLEAIMKKVYHTGERFTAIEMPVSLPRGGKVETTFCNFVYEPLLDGNTIAGVMAVVVEVTEQVVARQKIEEVVMERTTELANANEELKRSNANLEEFAYAASHDLKEPMRKIHLFSDRLKESLQGKLSLQEKGMLDRILYATQRTNRLIEDLLLYSHVSRGAVKEEEVDLNQKLKAVLEDLDLEIEEKGATITADPLPTIKGQRRQLQQLFQNLLSNAIKYNKPGVPPAVTIRCRTAHDADLPPLIRNRKDNFYLIEVSDNGIGFATEDAERIFNVFTRLHGNAEYKGTGVGLSIARKVAENHGGYIWAAGTDGGGATFRVLLPGG